MARRKLERSRPGRPGSAAPPPSASASRRPRTPTSSRWERGRASRAGWREPRTRAAAVLDEVPDVEWWDAHILANGSYDDVSDGRWDIKPEKITPYVEHPVPMQPPMEAPPPPPQPLKLTKREQKKLRTQRRQQREQEKQEMIRQGLLEPPKPKVKISNLMRVLTDEATADPTAIEKEVRKQMEERAGAHEDRNLARQLTPAERREKKIRKLFDDPSGGVETQVHVYRVESLSNPKNKFRVDINAQENRLSGESLVPFPSSLSSRRRSFLGSRQSR